MNIDAESAAHIELLNAFSVGLVNTRMEPLNDENEAEKGLGTGTAVRKNGRYLLLTARHNLVDASATDLEFMPKATSATVLGDPVESASRLVVKARRRFPIKEIVRCEWEDLAVLILDEAFDEQNEAAKFLQYYDWRDGLVSPEVGSTVHALGHPIDKTYVVADRRAGNRIHRDLGVSKSIISCNVVPNDRGRYVKDFDAERHFLLDYTHILDSHSPHGFSGCGLWQFREGIGAVWTANLCFSGVEISYVRRGALLVNVRPGIVSKWFDEIGL